jgi:hypothetical protein
MAMKHARMILVWMIGFALLLAPSVISAAPAADSNPVDPKPAAAGDLAPLEINFPKPEYIGTPPNLQSPNLEKTATRPPVMVPKGAVNLAKGKPVTGSDKEPIIGEMALITDGNKKAGDGYFVEFGPGLQHVQIDLGQKAEIWAIALWHFHSQARVYRDVIVQVADDPDFIKDVKTVFNNDHDNSAGLGVGKDKEYIETNKGRIIDAKGVKGRYVRLYSKGNTANEENHYIEVEVYGKPAK